MYEESEDAVLFPHCANHPDLYQFTSLPRNYFISIEDSNHLIEKKENFYVDFVNTDQSIKALLHDYLQTELTFLSNLCFKIEETGEAFQICLQKSEKLKKTANNFCVLTNYTNFFLLCNPYKLYNEIS